MRFRAKINSSCIWIAIPVGWVILHWYACATHGRSLGRSVYGHVITKFSRMGRLPHFLIHGAPLRASRARAPLKTTKRTLKNSYANKFSKTTVVIRFNPSSVCPFMPFFVFAVLHISCCNVLSNYFYVSLGSVVDPTVSILINYPRQLL